MRVAVVMILRDVRFCVRSRRLFGAGHGLRHPHCSVTVFYTLYARRLQGCTDGIRKAQR